MAIVRKEDLLCEPYKGVAPRSQVESTKTMLSKQSNDMGHSGCVTTKWLDADPYEPRLTSQPL